MINLSGTIVQVISKALLLIIFLVSPSYGWEQCDIEKLNENMKTAQAHSYGNAKKDDAIKACTAMRLMANKNAHCAKIIYFNDVKSLCTSVTAKAPAKEEKLTGIDASYRGLKWGSKPTADMKLIKDEGATKQYVRTEDKKVGKFAASSIKYHYGKNAGLYAIEATMRPSTNPVEFFTYLEKLLGTSGNANGSGQYEKQASWNKENLYAKYFFNPYSKEDSPVFFLAYQKYLKQVRSGN